MKNRINNKDYGQIINLFVACIGIVVILLGILIYRCCEIIGTIFLSVGTSILATAIVTKINAAYVLRVRRIESLLSKWKLYNIYETKADMNLLDANEALKQCENSIDIIAEGMHNYLAAEGGLLRDKILNHNVKIRIISCDSECMLKKRSQDEIGVEDSGTGAITKVKQLDQWVKNVQKNLDTNKRENLQIRYHSTYPGFSYLRIDKKLFVSANLWGKPSQQCFALSFDENGAGYTYFDEYFKKMWDDDSFVHEECKL